MSRQIILGSKSPRRKQILEQAGYQLKVLVTNQEEIVDSEIPLVQIPEFLAIQKADYIRPLIKEEDFILLTADTIVLLNDQIIGKPKDIIEAKKTLQRLSGEEHQVISGVCITTPKIKLSFSDITLVKFKSLTEEEINFYIEHFKVLDKAGSYAIQEWIGMIGIISITGSYYNVMGLPIHKVYSKLKDI